MFCTKCGTELRERDKFCFHCGTSTGHGSYAARMEERLSRPVANYKIAGVCAGFARYFGLDVTLVRIIWLVLIVWPVPLFGGIAYLVAWCVMPKDVVALPAPHAQQASGTAS